MGRYHAQAAVAAGASISGVVDQDFEAAKSLAAKCRGATPATSLEEALKAARATAAHICTPAATHAEIGMLVAGAGLHALIEKPLGVSAADVRRIHQAFEYSGRLACPTHQYAFQRSTRAASATLPRLGTLKQLAFDICSAGAAAGHISPDELIAEILPHPLSIAQQLVPGIDVAKLDWNCIRSASGEWLVAAQCREALVTISLSASGRPTRFRTQITAERGSIELDHFHDFGFALKGEVSKAQKIMAPFVRSGREFAGAARNLLARTGRREFAYPGLRTLVEDFYAAVRKGSRPPITPEQSIAVAEARDTILGLANLG
jgi:predicted dehydrogenase